MVLRLITPILLGNLLICSTIPLLPLISEYFIFWGAKFNFWATKLKLLAFTPSKIIFFSSDCSSFFISWTLIEFLGESLDQPVKYKFITEEDMKADKNEK